MAIELKTVDFVSEHLGQLQLYLEALDRDVRRPGDNPSVGIVLCAGKDDMVVEYALSSNMPPALVAEYQTYLPDKKVLEERLRRLKELTWTSGQEDGI